MNYNFDEIISRRGTRSVNYDLWRQHLLQLSSDTQLPYPDEEFIRLWIADMDFATPPEVLDAIRERLDDRILGYSHLSDPEYRDVLRSWFERRYRWAVDMNHLVVSPGVVPALARLVALLTEDGDELLINTPSYAPFQRAGVINGRKVHHSPLLKRDGRYELDLEDIQQQLEDPSKRIKVFIHCGPHNPTGRLWTADELLALGRICLEQGIWVISDEVHCDLLRQGLEHVALASLFPESDRIITCTAPSKTFNLAGSLLSNIFIPNGELRKEWMNLYGDSVNPLSVAATQAAYAQGENWLEQLKTYLDGNFALLKELLDRELPETQFRIPEATYLAWVDLSAYWDRIPEGKRATHFFAERAGVLIEDEQMFVANGKGHVRINVACPRAVLEKGIVRLIEAIRA